MTWAKLDDRFHSHPKIVSAGIAATGVYAMGLSYAACHDTDGLLPREWVKSIRGGRRHVERLLELDLWREVKDGYSIPDYLDFNPSKAEVEERRAKDARRKKSERNPSGLRRDPGRVGTGRGTAQ